MKQLNDTELLDYLEEHPTYEIYTYVVGHVRKWRIFDGSSAAYSTETIGKGDSLREAINRAIEFPYI